jgi:hypothetical protein
MAEMAETDINTRRNEARYRRDKAMHVIEQKAARKAIADVRARLRTRIYEAQTKALEEFREELPE